MSSKVRKSLLIFSKVIVVLWSLPIVSYLFMFLMGIGKYVGKFVRNLYFYVIN